MLQRDITAIPLTRIFGAIAPFINGRIGDHGLGRHARTKRSQIDEQLEGGTRLSLRLRCTVKGRLFVAFAADHGDNLPIGTHRDQGNLRAANAGPRNHLAGDILQSRVQRGGNPNVGISAFGKQPRLRNRPIGKIGARWQRLPYTHVKPRYGGGVGLGLCDGIIGHHGPQNKPSALRGTFWVLGRGQTRRRLDKPRQHHRLAERQTLRLAVEIMQRCSAQAIHIIAKIDVRQISSEDFILRQSSLEPKGDEHLPPFARQAALRGQEGKFRQLLRDRASALRYATAKSVGPKSTRKAARVDAPMRIKAAIFDRQKRLDNMRRQFGDIDRPVDNCPISRDGCPIGCQQRNPWWRNRLKRFRQRRSNRKPDQYQNKQRQDGRAAANYPPPTRFAEK